MLPPWTQIPTYICCVNIPYQYTVVRICWVQGGGNFNIKNGDDPIFVILTRNKFALKHVSLMHMSNETKTKAVLFQQYIFGMVLKQKNAAQTIGKQVFNSLNISGVRKCKY